MRKTIDVVRSLVGGQQPAAGRVDAEVARGLALGGCRFDRGQSAVVRIDGEDGDAIVAPVRAVDEPAGRVDLDLGRVANAIKALGQG